MLLEKCRQRDKLVTRVDNDLGHLLGSALAKYELTKATGSKFDSGLFEAAVKNHIPDGNVFKAFPIQLTHKNPLAIFEAIRDNTVIFVFILF